MDFKCHDVFMVRTPTLPLHIAKNVYKKDYRKIWEYICSLGLEDFFLEAILISSPTLYSSIKKLGENPKNDDATYISIYKYLLRASARTTPYGLFANVALGEFSKTKNPMVRHRKIVKKLYADSSWIFNLIYKLEKLHLSKLNLCWNKDCYISKNRMKNPTYLNHNISKSRIISECSIRYSGLIKLIRDASMNYIKYDNLVSLIKHEYPTSSEEQIEGIIQKLVEEEFLFTELRIPHYCDDFIEHIIQILNKEEILCNERTALIQIQELLSGYNCTEVGDTYLKKINELMDKYTQSNAYIAVDTNLVLENRNLDICVKEKLEKFVNCVSKLAIDATIYSPLEKLKEAFLEEYGVNVRIPINEVIDPSGFNGLAYYDEIRNNEPNSREVEIKSIFESRVQAAILNGDRNIKLYDKDFKDVDMINETMTDSFDLNIIITKEKEDVRLSVGPNLGATSAGKSFKRFSKILDSDLYEKYKTIYRFIGGNDISTVELREYSSVGRTVNLINQDRSFLNYLSLGTPDVQNESILLEDLTVLIDDSGVLILSDINGNIKYKLMVDNMVNPILNSKVFNLIKEISDDSIRGHLIERFDCLLFNEYRYTPAIYIEDVQVSPEKWYVKDIGKNSSSFDEFKNYFENFAKTYQVPEFFYLCKDDNRLPLLKGDEITYKILYFEYKRNGKLNLCAVESGFFSKGIICDENDDFYASEFVFSFYRENDSNEHLDTSIEILKNSSLIQNNNRIIMPFQFGWLYFKIYCNKSVEDDFLIAFNLKSKELMANEFFFVRYNDESGRHIRLRIKFPTQEDAISQYDKISACFLDFKEKDLINSWSIHEYHRECNRYGGEAFICKVEKIFFKNSNSIIEKISNNNMNDIDTVESVYLSEVGALLYNLSGYEKTRMLNILDKTTERNNYRKEYKKNRKKYITEINKILNEAQYDRYLVDTMIDLESSTELLTTNVDEIILSLIHMCCNRIKGDRHLEEKTYSILRHTLFDIISKDNYINR